MPDPDWLSTARADGRVLAEATARGVEPVGPPPGCSEDEFLAWVVRLATAHDWLVHHQRPARTRKGWRSLVQGDPGFPDCVLGRGPGHTVRLLVAELKVKSRPTIHQYAWLGCFQGAGVLTRVWTPADAPEIITTLTGG